jgi:hypothetical protein
MIASFRGMGTISLILPIRRGLVIDKRAGDLPYDLEDYFGFGWFPTEQKP